MNDDFKEELKEAYEKIEFLMKAHDDMADVIETMREGLLDIIAVVGLEGSNCGGRVLNIARAVLEICDE